MSTTPQSEGSRPGVPSSHHDGGQDSAAVRSDYEAAGTSSALFDFERTQLELTGRDRAKFLHNFCTNDIKKLQPGQGTEAFVTSVQGKVLGHLFVYAAPHALWLDSVPGSAAALLKHLQKYQITEDVEFFDRTQEVGTLFLSGPEAPQALQQLGIAVAQLQPLEHLATAWNDFELYIRRNDLLNAPGFQLVTARERLPVLRDALTAQGIRAAGNAAFEALRIEAGLPLYGIDITDANLAQEVARTTRAISFTKGCYLGQEPIARIDALGHVNQELRGIRFAAGPAPAAGNSVYSMSDPEKVIGRITSAALSPADGHPVALAYLRRGHEAPQTRVSVLSGDERVDGVVFWPAM